MNAVGNGSLKIRIPASIKMNAEQDFSFSFFLSANNFQVHQTGYE